MKKTSTILSLVLGLMIALPAGLWAQSNVQAHRDAVMKLMSDETIQKNQTGAPAGSYSMQPIDKKDDPYAGQGFPIVLGAGGPDADGYVWIDSDEAGGPTHVFQDISGTGTLIAGITNSDDVFTFLNFGINFPFYGTTYTGGYVSSNGIIKFVTGSTDFSNDAMPTAAHNEPLLAYFWDDHDPGDYGDVYYQTFSDRVIIQFDSVAHFNLTGAATFQVVLYDNGVIESRIHTLTNWTSFLASCTIGIQKDGASGLQVVYNAPYIHEHLTVMFIPDNLDPNTIPVSNWALGIGIFLIVAFTVIRMRRFS